MKKWSSHLNIESSFNNLRDNHWTRFCWRKKLYNHNLWWIQVWIVHLLWSLQDQEQGFHVPRRMWRDLQMGWKTDKKEEHCLQNLEQIWSGNTCWAMQQGRILCFWWIFWQEQPRVCSLHNVWRQRDCAKSLHSWKQGAGMKQWIYHVI